MTINRTDDFETFHLIVGDCGWNFFCSATNVNVTIIKTEIRKVYVVVNKTLDSIESAVGKKNVGNK